jgi:hypothetical protein
MNGVKLVLQNLYIVAKTGHRDRLVTEGVRFTIRHPSAFTGLLRRWWGEGREHTVESLNATLSSAMNIVLLCDRGDDDLLRDRVLMALRDSLVGVVNLARTYEDDYDVHARLTILIVETKAFLERQGALGPSSQICSESVPPSYLDTELGTTGTET